MEAFNCVEERSEGGQAERGDSVSAAQLPAMAAAVWQPLP
jgi:hypothetical protein